MTGALTDRIAPHPPQPGADGNCTICELHKHVCAIVFGGPMPEPQMPAAATPAPREDSPATQTPAAPWIATPGARPGKCSTTTPGGRPCAEDTFLGHRLCFAHYCKTTICQACHDVIRDCKCADPRGLPPHAGWTWNRSTQAGALWALAPATGAQLQEAQQAAVDMRKATLRVDQLAREQLAAENAAAAPVPVDGAAFLAEPARPVAWRIQDLMPAGSNVMLTAAFKSGKSTLAANLIRSWCNGTPFLGRHEITPADGPILVIDTEMNRDTARAWLKDHVITDPARFRYVNLRGAASALNVLSPAGRRQWANLAAGCSAIILDCLGPILGALGLDENHNPDVIRFLAGWDEMLAAAGIPESILIHHMGHGAERARGASRLRDWPDAEWRLVRQDEDPRSPRFFSAFGRDVDVAESLLAYSDQDRSLTIAGGSRKQASAAAASTSLAALLASSPGISRDAIEKNLGGMHSRVSIRAAIDDAARTGTVVIEPGPHGSRLHYPSSPARRSSPQQAGEVAPGSSPPPIRGRAGEDAARPGPVTETGELKPEHGCTGIHGNGLPCGTPIRADKTLCPACELAAQPKE